MQRKANQREKEAERKRVAAEASAARRAEEAAQRVEAHVAASYAVESTGSPALPYSTIADCLCPCLQMFAWVRHVAGAHALYAQQFKALGSSAASLRC